MDHRTLQYRRLMSYNTELDEILDRWHTMTTEALERLCDAIDAALDVAEYGESDE